MMAVSLFAVGALVGVGVDTSRLVSANQKTVDALDAATLYAALRSMKADSYDADAQSFLGGAVEGNAFTLKSSSFVQSGDYMIGKAMADLPLVFGGMLGWPNSIINVRAVVNINPPDIAPACIIALSPSKASGLLLNSGAKIISEGCEVHVHSKVNPAMTVNSGVTLDVEKTCVAGSRKTDNSGGAHNIEMECEVSPDPFAGQIPEPDSSSCTYSNGNYNGSNKVMSPGVYCGWHNFNNSSAVVTFEPGVYILKTGGWNVNGGTWSGDGVTFYYADTSKIQFNSGVAATFTSPTAGDYAGIFMAEREGLSNSQFVLNDSLGFNFEGAIHLPSRAVTLNSGSNNTVRHASIVADTFTVNGATLKIEPAKSGSSSTSLSSAGVYLED